MLKDKFCELEAIFSFYNVYKDIYICFNYEIVIRSFQTFWIDKHTWISEY